MFDRYDFPSARAKAWSISPKILINKKLRRNFFSDKISRKFSRTGRSLRAWLSQWEKALQNKNGAKVERDGAARFPRLRSLQKNIFARAKKVVVGSAKKRRTESERSPNKIFEICPLPRSVVVTERLDSRCHFCGRCFIPHSLFCSHHLHWLKRPSLPPSLSHFPALVFWTQSSPWYDQSHHFRASIKSVKSKSRKLI